MKYFFLVLTCLLLPTLASALDDTDSSHKGCGCSVVEDLQVPDLT